MNNEIENALNINKSDLSIIINKFDELIAATLDSKVTSKVPISKVLWSLDDIAEYLGLSYKYVQEYIVSHYSFPDAVRLKFSKAKKGHPRWYAGEVMEWITEFREG